jgi:carnitine O-palmitoyltransferase 2
MCRYLYCVKPLVSEEQYAATEKAVYAFRMGEGRNLQAKLEAQDMMNPHTSYISEMWYDMYLRNRDPFPMNLTPQLTWKADEIAGKNEQCQAAANLLAAAVRFKRTLDAGKLEPDAFALNPALYDKPWVRAGISLLPSSVSFYGAYATNTYPLDMSQYARLFSSTRIPLKEKDELRTYEGSRHVVVLRGSRLYSVDVIDSAGSPVAPEAVEAALRAVKADSEGQTGKELAVAALTGAERDTWAAARGALERNPSNAAALLLVDSALFALTLDDGCPEDNESLTQVMLHGDARNRWFDKSFNLVVAANGRAGVQWEHAWGDGVAVLRFFNDVYKEVSARSLRPSADAATSVPAEIKFDLSDSAVTKAIQDVTAYSAKIISECDLNVFQVETVTKNDIKASKLSPDGAQQMILQLAHYYTHGYTPATYESASTAAFKHGRTETIRSATPEAAHMCQVFADANSTPEARAVALSAACSKHFVITRDALMGQGLDRHLFALNHFAQAEGRSPSIFTDPSWDTMKDIRLSTSTLASPALDGGGFGPVSRTAYSVGYGAADRGMQFNIMSYALDNKGFAENARKAMEQIKAVMPLTAKLAANKKAAK